MIIPLISGDSKELVKCKEIYNAVGNCGLLDCGHCWNPEKWKFGGVWLARTSCRRAILTWALPVVNGRIWEGQRTVSWKVMSRNVHGQGNGTLYIVARVGLLVKEWWSSKKPFARSVHLLSLSFSFGLEGPWKSPVILNCLFLVLVFFFFSTYGRQYWRVQHTTPRANPLLTLPPFSPSQGERCIGKQW